MHLFRKIDYKKMHWKNGQGHTFEIDRYPRDAEKYFWRLSQAPILKDGPFSQFLGYERWLVILKGEGIYLNEQLLLPLQPFRFSGDQKILCHLKNKSVEDLGLLFNPSKISVEMTVIHGEIKLAPPTEQCIYYVFDLFSGDTRKYESDETAAEKIEVKNSVLITLQKL